MYSHGWSSFFYYSFSFGPFGVDLITVLLVIRAVAGWILPIAAVCVCVMESHSQVLKRIIERSDFSVQGVMTWPPGSQTLSPHTLHFLSPNCKSWCIRQKSQSSKYSYCLSISFFSYLILIVTALPSTVKDIFRKFYWQMYNKKNQASK